MKTTCTLLFLCTMLSMTSCVAGPDPLRHAAEQQSLALAKSLAEGWFTGQPVPAPADQQMVVDALRDIERRLAVDAAQMTGTPPPPPAPAPLLPGGGGQ